MKKSPRVKTVSQYLYNKLGLTNYPNFHATGSVKGMRKLYYGENALLIRCGDYIYNVSEKPELYYSSYAR